MADSQIEEIKNKLNILDVVGGYMKLTKTGINYRGVCPFHKEKTPSFFVSPGRQMWHCFGCGTGGSIFDFVMKIEGVEFGDALRLLATKAGVTLQRENIELRTERERLYEICELACRFFEKQLTASAPGKEVIEYLLGRGITKDTMTLWRIGYSPDTWNSLTDFLISNNYHREEIIKAGLAIPKEQNSHESYDRFRGRIMFPVFDINGRVIGFGGRVFKQQNETAKYINTPQTLLYDKSNVLYGLHRAKLAIRKQNQCVVTEGYTDVIMCHQAGFENTVAASGTALTTGHLQILKRYSEHIVLAFDADLAGDSATKRGITAAQEQGFNIKIIGNYLKDADPADIIKKDLHLWQQYVNEAQSIIAYYIASAFATFDPVTAEGKKEIGKIVLPALKQLPNHIERASWIHTLSEKLGVPEESIVAEIAKITIAKTSPESTTPAPTIRETSNISVKERKSLLEEKVIALILKHPTYAKLVGKIHYDALSKNAQQFIDQANQFLESLPEESQFEEQPSETVIENTSIDSLTQKKDIQPLFSAFLSASNLDTTFKHFLESLALRGEIEYADDDEHEFSLCLLAVKQIELKRKLHDVSERIKKAEISGDHETIHVLMDEFSTLTKELQL